MNGKKPLLITAGILFFVIVVASAAYGVLAYTAQPANVDNIASEQNGGESSENQSQGDTAGQNEGEDAQDEAVQRVEAPDFTVFDENGEAVTLSSLEGKPVVINFWTSWCTYCKQEMPDFQEVYDHISFLIEKN